MQCWWWLAGDALLHRAVNEFFHPVRDEKLLQASINIQAMVHHHNLLEQIARLI